MHNARLPVRPFRRAGRLFAVRQMHSAAQALQDAFAEGDFAGYLEYRMGDERAASVRTALAAIIAACDDPVAHGARVAFDVTITERAPGR